MSNFDEALERFHLGDLEYSGGLASHGPMAAEALECLGHQALIPAFLDIYVPRLPPAVPGRPLDERERVTALGDVDRRADWVASFESLLDEGDWRDVVATSVPSLLPGLFAAAGHGFLRTAHAIRSLEREDSALRRRELALGLAYWSARFQRLPGVPGDAGAAGGAGAQMGTPESLDAMLDRWPLVGESEARAGLIFEVVRRLETFAAFAQTIERAKQPEPGDLDAFLGALCRKSAKLYLAHPEARIAYVHALTLPSAMRLVAPVLAPQDAAAGAFHVLQAVGALHSMFGQRREPVAVTAEVETTAESWDEIRYRAACSIQEHAIKMTEACWREDRLAPDRVFRLAAADAALNLEGQRSTGGC